MRLHDVRDLNDLRRVLDNIRDASQGDPEAAHSLEDDTMRQHSQAHRRRAPTSQSACRRGADDRRTGLPALVRLTSTAEPQGSSR